MFPPFAVGWTVSERPAISSKWVPNRRLRHSRQALRYSPIYTLYINDFFTHLHVHMKSSLVSSSYEELRNHLYRIYLLVMHLISFNIKFTHNAELFMSAKDGTRNIAPPNPSKVKETPFNQSELKYLKLYAKSTVTHYDVRITTLLFYYPNSQLVNNTI